MGTLTKDKPQEHTWHVLSLGAHGNRSDPLELGPWGRAEGCSSTPKLPVPASVSPSASSEG